MADATAPVPVLTIDGPSGVGKGTVARVFAREFGWHYLDSGALYRVIAYAASEQGVDSGDGVALAAIATGLEVEFDLLGDGSEALLLAGQDVANAIRSEECGRMASMVAALPEVRAALLKRQRHFRSPPGLVADGRDMGTVVFPDAALKIFLAATPEERARRRHKQLKQKGLSVSLAALSGQMRERDERDKSRSAAPLVAAEDARLIDTTSLDVDEVVEVIRDLAKTVGLVVPVA